MTRFTRRTALVLSAVALAAPSTAFAQAAKEIRVDWATYNPVSMLLKDKGFLEKEFAKDGVTIRWVQTRRLQQCAASSSTRPRSISVRRRVPPRWSPRSTATRSSRSIPIRVRNGPRWWSRKDSKITKLEDLKGKKVAMVRGTDPHIFAGACAALGRPDRQGLHRRCWCSSTSMAAPRSSAATSMPGLASIRAMAQFEIKEGAKLFYRKPEANTWGILNVREEFAKDNPQFVSRVISAYEEARKYALANPDELKKIFIGVTKLDEAVVDKQLKERTELTHNRVGPAQRESILEAGLALQKAGVDQAGRRRQEGRRRSDRRQVRDGHELIELRRGMNTPPRDCRWMPDGLCSAGNSGLLIGMTDVHPRQTPPDRLRRQRRGAGRWAASCGRRSASLLPVGLAVFWELAVKYGWSNGRLVPPPSVIFKTFVELVERRRIAASCRGDADGASPRVSSSASLSGTILGALAGYSALLHRVVDPSLQALRAIPSIAWVPLFILWFGIFEASKIILIAVGVFFPVYLGVMGAVSSVDRKIVEVGRAFRLSGFAHDPPHPAARRAAGLCARRCVPGLVLAGCSWSPPNSLARRRDWASC